MHNYKVKIELTKEEVERLFDLFAFEAFGPGYSVLQNVACKMQAAILPIEAQLEPVVTKNEDFLPSHTTIVVA